MVAHRPPVRIAEHGRPTHTLLHLSDTHLVGYGLLCDTLDATARLRRTLERITSSGVRPDAVVITGDLADEGEPAAYRELRSLVVPWVERLGAELVWVMGNHDDRGVLRGVLLDGGDPRPGPQPPLDEVRDLAGLRLVTLDTTVPGHHHGALEPAQLRWLAEVLAEPAPHGTVLALHHPPVPAVQDLAVLVELRGQPALAEVLRGSDVRAILGGHLHHSCSATFAGIPVSVAAATCYTQDLTVPGAGTRGRDAAQAYHLVQVHTDTVLHVVVPLDEGDTVGRPSDAADTARRLADAGVIIPAAAPTAPRRQTPSTSQGARTGK